MFPLLKTLWLNQIRQLPCFIHNPVIVIIQTSCFHSAEKLFQYSVLSWRDMTGLLLPPWEGNPTISHKDCHNLGAKQLAHVFLLKFKYIFCEVGFWLKEGFLKNKEKSKVRLYQIMLFRKLIQEHDAKHVSRTAKIVLETQNPRNFLVWLCQP